MSMYFCDLEDVIKFAIVDDLANLDFSKCFDMKDIRNEIRESIKIRTDEFTKDEIFEAINYIILDDAERRCAEGFGVRFDNILDLNPWEMYNEIAMGAFDSVWPHALAAFLKGERNA